MKYLEIIFCTLLLILITSCSKSKYDYLNQESQIITVKSKFSTNNFKKIRILQFSETRFGSFVGLFSCFYVYKQ